ncbi:MAG: hypothetical protein ACE5HS_21105 [bacterium]
MKNKDFDVTGILLLTLILFTFMFVFSIQIAHATCYKAEWVGSWAMAILPMQKVCRRI